MSPRSPEDGLPPGALGAARRGWLSEGGFRAVEGEILGLVVEDGTEEGVVVGGAGGGDLPKQKVDVAGSGDGQTLGGVLGGEGGVIASDGSAGWGGGGRAGGKMQSHVGFDFEGSAEFDGGSGGTWGRVCGRVGQA